MRKVLFASAAFVGVLGLAACNNATQEPNADASAASADGAATDAADTSGAAGGGAASASDSGSDASATGAVGGDTATAPSTQMSPTSTTDPMVTGQGSTREQDPSRGQIDMPSEPAHPARQ